MGEYIKSPLNYVGGKYKLLSNIIPLFPKNITTFVDLFGGGFNVGINIDTQKIIYNDKQEQVVELLQYMYNTDLDAQLNEIDELIIKYGLSKDDSEGFLKLRKDYNNGVKEPMVFYTLICYAFNYQIRFNNSGEYNMPSGKSRSSFNPVLRDKYKTFVNVMHTKNIKFYNNDFSKLNVDKMTNKSFIYADHHIITLLRLITKMVVGLNKTKIHY